VRLSQGNLLKDYCPRCGAARVGAFQFCRGCGFDFDGVGDELSAAAADLPKAPIADVSITAARPTGRRISGRGLLGAGLAIAVGLAGINSARTMDPTSAITAGASASATAAPSRAIATATPTQIAAIATSTAALATSEATETTFGPTGQTTVANVVRVVDGDTIVVAYAGQEYKVRYIGMDTPETVDPASPVQWMGAEASAANLALVDGKSVVLEKDVSETDRYGRLLRYVWLTDGVTWTLVNAELVIEGFASVATFPPDVKYADVYLAAQQEAQANGIGLWGAHPTAKPTPKPTPKATPKPIAKATPKPSKCHPSYDPCLPIVGDLNCPDVRAMGKAPVMVIGPDDYRLDRDGDGIGCE
jgi:micrococcal nuclease